MAGNFSTSPFDYDSRMGPVWQTQDFPIQGKMIIARYHSHDDMTRMTATVAAGFTTHVKHTLALELAKGMMHEGMISFTKIDDPKSFETIYLARCFVTPNEQVQILRTLQK